MTTKAAHKAKMIRTEVPRPSCGMESNDMRMD
jgi:hypothetical protein